MQSDRDYIVLYRSLVETKFLLGSSDGKLKQRELEYLGEMIEEKSNVKLSISTLKRLWRNDLKQLPHPSTLDALVSLLDLKDWQEFKKMNAHQLAKTEPSAEKKEKKPVPQLPVVVIGFAIFLTGAFVLLQGFNKKGSSVVVKGEVGFTADKTVSSGVPNTVMFHYDLSAVQADSFFIQQSWNPRDKVKIDPSNNYYSATYYTPGFHFARIMANDSILKFTKVHIKSDGWLPLVKYDLREKRHFYLDAGAVRTEGVLKVDRNILEKATVDMAKDFLLRYYNVRDFDEISSNNFDLETRLRCEKLSEAPAIPCPQMELMLITEENVFFVPLTTKGCISELELLIGEVYKGGKDNDLSALGTDPFVWQTLRIKNENKHTSIFLNGSLVHELEYTKDFGDIKGMIFTFTGAGAIDFVRIKNIQGQTVYEDEFDHVSNF
jgi:hypothetical protein